VLVVETASHPSAPAVFNADDTSSLAAIVI
jgi:hypothetical protein